MSSFTLGVKTHLERRGDAGAHAARRRVRELEEGAHGHGEVHRPR